MIAQLDYAILEWFLSLQNDLLTPILRFITYLGEAGAIWIVIGVIFTIWKTTRWIGITMLLALIFTLIVGNLTLKPLIARPRPNWIHPEVELLIKNPTDYSFPSGHAMSSFAAATAAWLWNRKIGWIMIIGAMIMAFTRLYFFVHYPTDILAGMMIGIVLANLAYAIVKRIPKRRMT